MKNISCLIVDDEPLACKVLEKYILETPGLKLSGIFHNAQDVIEFLSRNSVDIVFTDIRMPGLDGIQLSEYLRELKINVVITSAYSEFGAVAFDKDVVDYLLKPFSYDRFLRTIAKIRSRELIKYQGYFSGFWSDYIFFKSEKKLRKVFVQDIFFIEALSNYLLIHLKNEKFIVRETMTRMMEKLPSELFFRVHKSFIVNVMKINHIEGNCIVLNDEEIPIGEAYKENFLRKIGFIL
ncbi:MAG: LytTR family DNA-binding domain-containing protein [Flavobacteriales bacterium]|nr:LytTR family DNA-binding domain-containing protein [Flavobacteriales bacterium]MDW8409873.1 LytTR family DNA-binding domain-containing protein [Flavobacteriales bacterium]